MPFLLFLQLYRNLDVYKRQHLYTSLGALKIGMDILLKEEGVTVDKILGHGGF